REKICEHLTTVGIEPVWDDRLRAGDGIDPTLQKLIRRADGIVSIGTQRFMESEWCCKEISFAIERGKRYYPLLFKEETGFPDMKAWFRGKIPGKSREVRVAMIQDADD